MKKFFEKKRKFIFVATALILVAGILVLDLSTKPVEVAAKQNIFQPVNDYSSEITVLEIMPDDKSEIGYFIPNTGASSSGAEYGPGNGYYLLSEASLGTRYGDDSPNFDQQHMDLLIAMRRYGLIKYEHLDVLATNGVSENPIYTVKLATFTSSLQSAYTYYPLTGSSNELVLGDYTYDAAAASRYLLDEANYALGDGTEKLTTYRSEDGQSWLTKLEANKFYKKVSLAGQEIISENDIGTGKRTGTADDYGYVELVQPTGIPVAIKEVTDNSGNLKFSYIVNGTGNYQGYSVSSYYYLGARSASQGTFKNGNWFREYILGDAAANATINYQCVTADTVTVDMINNADLVYISGTSKQYTDAGKDLTDDVVAALYNRTTQGYDYTQASGEVITKYQAIMMDYASFSTNTTPVNNIDRLAMLTWRESQTSVTSQHTADGAFDEAGKMLDVAKAWSDPTLFTELSQGMYVGYNGTFAVNNIYVYNHHWTDYQDSKLKNEQVDALDNFANGDLKSAFSAAAASQGFSSVLSYIKLNNQNTVLGHVPEGIVTPALAIQYILSYRGEDLGIIKSQYSVLEIQPTKEFLYNEYNESVAYGFSSKTVQDNRDEFIRTFFGEEMVKGNRQEYVTFDSMTIDEFNTRQIDLLATYDVIYIGDEWSKYYSTVNNAVTYDNVNMETVTSATIPKQSEGAGNIYYNLGAIEPQYEEVTDEKGNKSTVKIDNLVYSSRDLTKAKLKELKNYLDNDALIIVGADLMSTKSLKDKDNNVTSMGVTINPTAVTNTTAAIEDAGRVDTSSNLYELLMYSRGFVFDATAGAYTNTPDGVGASIKGNLVSEYDIALTANGRMAITPYLGRSRLSLNMLEVPTAYSYTTNELGGAAYPTYLEKDTDGKYYLRFEFSIENSEVDAALGQTYNIHYYEDTNSDGKFGASEEKTDFQIKGVTSESGTASTVADGITVYNLQAGVAYELERQVPSDEGGVINWAIRVEKTGNANVSTMESGYVAIKPMNRKVLNILQITDADADSLNLEAMEKTSDLGKFLYAPVVMDHYDIKVRTITTAQFEQDLAVYASANPIGNFSTSDAWALNYFATFQRSEGDIFPAATVELNEEPMNVNMVILGFGDSMENFGATALTVLDAYIDSGRPILTSNSVIAEGVNTSLASITGVDRYGYFSPLYKEFDKSVSYMRNTKGYEAYATLRENAGNAVGYTRNFEKASTAAVPYGVTNTVIRSTYRTIEGTPSFFNNEAVQSFINGVTPDEAYMFVDKMNDGQITHFPYTIDEHVIISRTHAQTYQLDLDTDADGDMKSDAVAWFTLSAMTDGSSYDSVKNGQGLKSGDVYIATPGDGINNYYIYNYGNVTYSGLDIRNSTITSGEAQLFVNTLLAAYESGLKAPIVEYYQTPDVNDGKLDSIAVAYDGNITGQNAIDSSIIYDEATRAYLYKFVNPNTDASVDVTDATKAYFKITDSNFVRGKKVADVAFYLGVTGKSGDTIEVKDGNSTRTYTIQEITLNDNTVATVVRIPITIYNSDFSDRIGESSSTTAGTTANPQLEVGTMYGFYAPMSYIEEMGAAKIYIQANTGYLSIDDTGKEITKPLGTSYDMFTIIKQDLLKLD